MVKDPSHEEVWDDSALVTSWNKALEEYKKYHSLAAKGEKVEVVLERAVNGERENDESNSTLVTENATQPAHVSVDSTNGAVEAPAVNDTHPATQHQGPVSTAAVPQMLLNQMQDEALKNVMMGWYYAGYYTGLYEGQQKAYATMQQGG